LGGGVRASRRAFGVPQHQEGLILKEPPTGPRNARPEDKLRGCLEGCAALSQQSMGAEHMSLRLVVTITAAPGKGGELAQAYRGRCTEVMKEPGCEQFEVFQSVLDPDKLVLLERWVDQAALNVHAKVNETRPSLPAGLRVGAGEREDYEYHRTR
jgi:quinol monooxygenase YgiN